MYAGVCMLNTKEEEEKCKNEREKKETLYLNSEDLI